MYVYNIIKKCKDVIREIVFGMLTMLTLYAFMIISSLI